MSPQKRFQALHKGQYSVTLHEPAFNQNVAVLAVTKWSEHMPAIQVSPIQFILSTRIELLSLWNNFWFGDLGGKKFVMGVSFEFPIPRMAFYGLFIEDIL